MNEDLEGAGSIEEISRVIETLKAPFKPDHLEEGTQTAALAVNNLQSFEDLIHKHMSDNEPFVFKNGASGEIHVVRILKNETSSIQCEESKVTHEGKYAIGIDPIARKNYKRLGIVFKKKSIVHFQKRNVILLDRDFLSDFWENRILTLDLTLNIDNPHGLGENFFEDWIPRLVESVHKSEFLECYRRRGETEKVTIKVTYDARYEMDVIQKEVWDLAQTYKLL